MDEQLALVAAKRVGELTMPHVTPWSAVFSARTSLGRVWLKVPAPDNTFEAELYRILLEEDPDHVLTPIASDFETGWLLLPDGGLPLAEIAVGSELVEAMCVALQQYGQLQLATASRSEEMLSIGLGDLRPQFLADRFEEAVARMSPTPGPLIDLAPTFAAWCKELTASPLTATLDHNDLHPWNVLGLGPGKFDQGTAIFYDWGDSVVAHPFGSTLEPISRVCRLAGLGADHADVRRMRDAYLEVFDHILTRHESVTVVETAWCVAKAARPIIWGGTTEEIQRYIDHAAHGVFAL
jgi:hypothetical protein